MSRPQADGLPSGLAPRVVAFCDELRREGLAVGTSEILDAFAALETVPWEQEDDFREALAATVAKSQEDRRVFELLFDRFFFRAAEQEALGRGIGEGRRYEGGERLELDELREAVRQAIAEGRDGEMRDLARLAISAFGRPRRGLGRDRGGRAAHPAHPRPPGAGRKDRGGGAGAGPRADQPLRAPPAPRARAGADRAHREAAARPARSPSSTERCPPARRRTWPPSTGRSRS